MTDWYERLGLKAKFAIVTTVIVVAICGGLFFFIELILRAYLRSEMQQQASEVAEVLNDQFANPSTLQNSTDRLMHERREISRIAVYRREGNAMVLLVQSSALEMPSHESLYSSALHEHTSFRYEFNFQDREYWEFAFPVLSRGHVAGLTAITLNFSHYKSLLSGLATGSLVILTLGLVAMLLCMNLYVEITIRRPLANIVSAMEKVKQSRFETRVTVHSKDEIGKLAEDFNTMTLSLGEANDEVRRQNRILEQRVNEATSELRMKNLELFGMQSELRRAGRLATAGQVGAMLAHDLGSPLSSISGHLQLMLEDSNRTEEDCQRLQLVLSQVERLSDTIHNFLKNVSSPAIHTQDCDLNTLLQHLVELVSPLLSEKRVYAELELDRRLPLVMGDPHQLQQVFLNLFTNALDAMKNGGTLSVKTQRSENGVEVRIADTGAGMKPETLKNLFQPFFSTKEFGKGTGLGMAICKEIVKAHGGEIDVESAEGSGTQVTILLPLPVPS